MIGVKSNYDGCEYTISFDGSVWALSYCPVGAFQKIWSPGGNFGTFEEAMRALWSRLGTRRVHIHFETEQW